MCATVDYIPEHYRKKRDLTLTLHEYLPQQFFFFLAFLSPPFLFSLATSFLPPSQERAKKIIDLARKYSLLVVCDDIYNLLYFPEKGLPLERLFTYDDK